MEFLETHRFLIFVVLAIAFFFDVLFTVEVVKWVPFARRRFWLIVGLWVLPVVGMFIANKYGEFGWFKKGKGERGAASIAQGFLQAGSVFNPGMRHQVELVDKQQAEDAQDKEATAEGEDGKDD